MNQIPRPQPASSGANSPFSIFGRHPAITAVAVMTVYFVVLAWPHRDKADDFHYRRFGRLPVIDQGRFKPMDTSARIGLMLITHRQSFTNPDDDVTYPATKWYLDSATVAGVFRQEAAEAYDYKIFRIENEELTRMLNIKRRPSMRYSYNEIFPEGSKNRELLVNRVRHLAGDDEAGIAAVDARNYTLLDAKIMELWQHLQVFEKINAQSAPLVIPDANGSDQWKSLARYYGDFVAQQADVGNGVDAQTFKTYMQLLMIYGGANGEDLQSRKKEFNKVLDAHLAELDKTQPSRMRAIDLEIFFNEFKPFQWSWIAYVAIAVFAASSWLAFSAGTAMRRAAFAAMAAIFVVHTGALILRMYLQGRPPVTNLYSSAIFIGWGCVGISMIAEAIFKNGISTVVGCALGFATLIIADWLSLDGDTMVMMQAVLDTNFWLATHVTC
ncbi:MAG TPA: hypothetical protein VFE62_26040, partial [Gemmataceae bacterium]|nr:hypothetical protein [Gemmataceae bacterium]